MPTFIGFLDFALIASVIVGMIAAWLTHILSCLATNSICFLITGAVFFPIGIFHGFFIWLGWC